MPESPTVESQEKTPRRARLRRVILSLFLTALSITAVFGSAGTLKWTRGWICLAAYFLTMIVAGRLVKRRNPGLMEARAKFRRKDTKPFDKIFLRIYLPFTLIHPAVAGLDAVRFRWTSMPFWTVYAGLLLFFVAMGLSTWVLMVNPHAESTVRIQTDRGHTVISSGPYHWVRHPMYVGAILTYPAASLIFGSVWALAVSGLIAGLLIWRTALEDRTLRQELPGYEDFTAMTRYRLIPGVW